MTELDIKEYNQRLERHDWHWEYSEDAVVRRGAGERESHLELWSTLSPQHRQLWEGYREARRLAYAIEPNTPGRAASLQAPIRAAQIAAGVYTQAELDAQDEEKRQRKLRDKEREQERKRQELVEFDELCRHHDWFYWFYECDSPEYIDGAQERRRLLEKAPTYLKTVNASGAYVRLFRAWAGFKNAEEVHVHWATGGELDNVERYNQSWQQLKAVREELGLPPIT